MEKRNSSNMRQWKAIALSFIIYHLAFSPAGAQNKFIQAVDEYVPAPGQFVNIMPPYTEGDTPESMALKCTDSIGGGNSRPDLPKGQTHAVTLGAYGGYITFHFDHPIANIEGQRDFAVWGNAFTNNAEPAIVMVAIDEKTYNKLLHLLRLVERAHSEQKLEWFDYGEIPYFSVVPIMKEFNK